MLKQFGHSISLMNHEGTEMSKYNELVQQAQALMAQAEKVRKDELAAVINEIKEKMKAHGITVADLGGVGKKSSKAKAPAKYSSPNGETWSGGPGRKPAWVKAILDAGGDIEKYRI